MKLENKIERQYQKYSELEDKCRNEFDQKRVDKAFTKLQDMFTTKEAFQEYWKSKINTKIFVNR